ncbi:MAG: histidine triad nucleotide-binding protein [Fastidiosipilaceae bacterium]|jgi:histidine triad (HIT) family protein|nr:histidine triad nucleotide-binding protein [Clostridiaceae bacterium]
MDSCVFCKIIAGDLPSTRVYEDDKVIAFKDLNPVAPVHVLVVPRQHIVSINEFAEQDPAGELAIHLMNCIPKVAEACGVVESGYRLINNCGKDGGQTVPHFHIHIIGGEDLGPGLR